jgi:hypothetical protein
MNYCTVPQDRKIKRRPVERDELRRQFGNANDEINSFSERSPTCGAPSATTIQRPSSMSNQSTNANDRVINMLGKLVAHLGANFVIALTVMTVGSGEALDVGDGFDVPNDDGGTHANY